MKIFVCLDDAGGMMFNRRRQSRDRAVLADILNTCAEKRLWMNGYSAKLFQDNIPLMTDNGAPLPEIFVDEAFYLKAQHGDYCFVENTAMQPYAEELEQIIIYKWHRKYPADVLFDIALESWHLCTCSEFEGYSHEKITKEVYIKNI